MYRKIVVGYNGTEEARDALALATSLRASDGVVVAACVFPEAPSRRGDNTAVAEIASDALASARGEVEGDWLEPRAVSADSPAQGLHVLCERLGADLVVLGSSRAAAPGRLRAGRIAERLLNGSPCPVVVAPEGFREDAGSPRVIGVAYDASAESEAALAEGVALATEFEAAMRLITVVPPLQLHSAEPFAGAAAGGDATRVHLKEAYRRALGEASTRLPSKLRAAPVLGAGDPASVIADEAGKGVHLLVLGSRSYGPLRRVFAGSTAIELMRHAPCPVMVIPRGAATPSADAAATAPAPAHA